MSRRAVLQKKCQEYVDGEPQDGVAVIRKVSFTMVETKVRYGGFPCPEPLHHHTPEGLLILAEEADDETLDAVQEFLSTLGMTAPVVVEKPLRSHKKRKGKQPKK